MKLGIVGSGMIGGTLGRLLANAAHEVMFSSRNPDGLSDLAASVGSYASFGTVTEAIAFADTLIFAIPFGAWPQISAEFGEQLAGKVVIDTANPYSNRDGNIVDRVTESGLGSGIFVAKLIPHSKVVKAFNTIYFQTLIDRASKLPRIAIPIAGDDSNAVLIVQQLVVDAGFDCVLAGQLSDSKRFDAGTAAYNRPVTVSEMKLLLGL
jgi:8-hydroxy-5-deazaflavin:NADPH oxidoreductase